MKKLSLLIILFTIGCDSNKKYQVNKIEDRTVSVSRNKSDNLAIDENEKKSYYRTEGLREQFVGKKLSEIRNDYKLGNSQTLNGTTDKFWLVYFMDINATMKILKSSDEILNICSEKRESLFRDKSIELKKFLGRKYTNDEYSKIINSIKYGRIEILVEDNCINNNCVEYYPKGNFTTMSFYEFNDEGDYVKFNRIGFGKLYNLSKYDDADLKEYYIKKIEVKTISEYSERVEGNLEFKKLRKGSTLVGKWYVKIKGLPNYNYQYEIYNKGESYFGVMISESASIETLTKKGNRYYKDNSKFGDYYTAEENLKFYDNDGLITDYEGSSID